MANYICKSSHGNSHEFTEIFQRKEETSGSSLVFISAEKRIIFKVGKTLHRVMNHTLVKWLPDTSGYFCGVIFEKAIAVFS